MISVASSGNFKESKMGTGRKFNKKPDTRPRKSVAERKSRSKVHKARLVAIGFDPAAIDKMTVVEVRELLKRHAKKSTRKGVEAMLSK